MNRTDAITFSLDAWFDSAYGAEQITYNGVSIYAHVLYGGNGAMARHATIIVQVSDVAEPEYRDPVIINGVTWRVFRGSGDIPVKGDGQTWEIPIFREEKSRR